MCAPRLAAIGLIALRSAHAVEQNALSPNASTDNALAITTAPAVTPAIGPIDAAPIEAPPLPRPRPSLRDTVADGAAALISAFRQQHGRGIGRHQPRAHPHCAGASERHAVRNSLDHNPSVAHA